MSRHMSVTGTIAMSGLNAASLRLQVAASNIANASSSGPLPDAPNAASFPAAYQALTVTQSGLPDGGTRASVNAVHPATVAAYDPGAPFANSNGLVASPNVDLNSQVVDLLAAGISFAANAAVVRAEARMTGSLFNILA
jgi:flagellar basal-body rod protein FlgC